MLQRLKYGKFGTQFDTKGIWYLGTVWFGISSASIAMLTTNGSLAMGGSIHWLISIDLVLWIHNNVIYVFAPERRILIFSFIAPTVGGF